ncbi:Protein CBG27965 [Caenorhabditis briggsae]|uniref:Uncharacterized protein n=2 Tax=Caenorhabditis briggsae TaxID=6238 RepID=A0AAE8ZTP5_CAEBR|nr:Protein CBG27965 [Caenorhabditis briggsae]ULT83843.1 hypothetical protein L3Y34_012851 [Caenorhabditis briggsae]CAS00137.1 Protein CBG27965 [Caenorhabditis briggsae]
MREHPAAFKYLSDPARAERLMEAVEILHRNARQELRELHERMEALNRRQERLRILAQQIDEFNNNANTDTTEQQIRQEMMNLNLDVGRGAVQHVEEPVVEEMEHNDQVMEERTEEEKQTNN